MADRSAQARFGGAWSWKLADGKELSIGEVIEGEGPGKGVAISPWPPDDYERVLRLRPAEAWLVKRLLRHCWEHGKEVFVSLHKIERRSLVSRVSLQTYMRRLRELGYVRVVSEGGGKDRRKRYDLSGIYAALALCIVCDPGSKWSRGNGGAFAVEQAKAMTHMNKRRFLLDFEALRRLSGGDGGG